MKRLLLAGLWLVLAATVGGAAPAGVSEQMLRERKHFLECLAVVYHPSFWISYRGSLYFQTKNEAQARQLEAMKTARAGYVAFLDRQARHELVAQTLADSGLAERWQSLLLLPYSETNQNLTPTLLKPFQVLSRYTVLQNLGQGDALLQDGDQVCFVMDFGHGAGDGSSTNACLVHEGSKTYTQADGAKRTVEAFTSAGLSREETAVLAQASAAFHKKAESVNQEIADIKARRDFAETLARASDRNPSVQYQLAIAYFEGRGTATNQQLGLEWLKRAAHNGSGDAQAYLDKLGGK